MAKVLTDSPAPYTVPDPPYQATTTLTGETVKIDGYVDGLELVSDALFADGWLSLPWADVAALVLALTEALAWRMKRDAAR